MKYKILFNGTLTTCDGSRHIYDAMDEHKMVHQPNSALCWCASADHEQLDRWSLTIQGACEKRWGEITK